MKRTDITIKCGGVSIPAVLWGERSDRLLICVHGMMASKEDPVILAAAEEAERRGMCALSFDLPRHGERGGDTSRECTAWNGREELLAVYGYAKSLASDIRIFACSLGAYMTMLALPDMEVSGLLLLSPVTSMVHMIEGMMAAAGVTVERLEAEGVIPVPGGQDLSIEYYRYAKEHPIKYDKRIPMAILRGENDLLCAFEDVKDFAEWYGAELKVFPGGEHWFHTSEQMAALSAWLSAHM